MFGGQPSPPRHAWVGEWTAATAPPQHGFVFWLALDVQGGGFLVRTRRDTAQARPWAGTGHVETLIRVGRVVVGGGAILCQRAAQAPPPFVPGLRRHRGGASTSTTTLWRVDRVSAAARARTPLLLALGAARGEGPPSRARGGLAHTRAASRRAARGRTVVSAPHGHRSACSVCWSRRARIPPAAANAAVRRLGEWGGGRGGEARHSRARRAFQPPALLVRRVPRQRRVSPRSLRG